MIGEIKKVGIFLKYSETEISVALKQVYLTCLHNELEVVIEKYSYFTHQEHLRDETEQKYINQYESVLLREPDILEKIDLAIVIGGDGTFLGVSRKAVRYDIPVVGVNLGTLGFLTSFNLETFATRFPEVLRTNNRIIEKRLVLQAEVKQDDKVIFSHLAINEIVLHKKNLARLIDFDSYIDGKFLASQSSDGIIISTATGSTAYSLSAGGTIIEPELDVISLIPNNPHTFSLRPIIINSSRVISLKLKNVMHGLSRSLSSKDEDGSEVDRNTGAISCDGQGDMYFYPHQTVEIKAFPKQLIVIHPTNYSYIDRWQNKLHWGKK